MIKKSLNDLDDKYPVPSACFLINVLTSNEKHIFFALHKLRSALSYCTPAYFFKLNELNPPIQF